MIRTFKVVALAALMVGTAFAGCLGGTPGADDKTGPGNDITPGNPSASTTSPGVGDEVRFSAGLPPEATDWTAEWSFGDGETSTALEAVHAYELPGQYVVGLSLTSPEGEVTTNDHNLMYVNVLPGGEGADPSLVDEDSAPVAQAASSKVVVKEGDQVRFHAGGSGGWQANSEYDPEAPYSPSNNAPFTLTGDAITDYTWTFGDGETADGEDVNHTFSESGFYPVTLTVTADNGKTASYVVTVRVLEPAQPVTPARNKNVFTHVTLGEPESLDPAYDYESAGGAILQQTYETLFYYERDNADKLKPVLATELPTLENGGVSADGLTYTIHLRQGVPFHTGGEMTAEDVKFSLDRIVLMNDPHGPAWIYSPIKGAEHYMFESDHTAADRQAYLDEGGVEIVDEDTVRIHLDYPDPAFPYRLAYNGASVVSKAYVCEHMKTEDCLPPVGETRDPWMDTHVAGTGPFMVERWLPNQMVILKRFNDYWGEAPALEKVQILKVDDTNTRLLMLYSGQADSVYVPFSHAEEVMNKPGVEVFENAGWTVSFIGFNQKIHGDDAPRGADGTPDPDFFADEHMRRAWTHAFDYRTYHEEILSGHGRMLNGPLPKGIFGYDESIPNPEQNLEKAREELAKSNHPDGFSITIYYNSGNTIREQTSQLLKQNLEALHPGIDVDVRGLDWATAFLPKLRAGELPVYYLGWAPDYAFPDNYVVSFAHSQKGVFTKPISYENPEVDALLDRAATEPMTEDELKDAYSDAVRMINDDAAFLWLAQASNLHVQRDYVEGYYFNPMHNGVPNIGDYAAISKA